MKLDELNNLFVLGLLLLNTFHVLCIKFISLPLFYLDIIDMRLFEGI